MEGGGAQHERHLGSSVGPECLRKTSEGRLRTVDFSDGRPHCAQKPDDTKHPRLGTRLDQAVHNMKNVAESWPRFPPI